MKNNFGLKASAALLFAASMALPAVAQNASPGATSSTPTPASAQAGSANNGMNASDNSTYATGTPLATQSKEGFWGHLNPFARKKWVNRQLDPVKRPPERAGSAAGEKQPGYPGARRENFSRDSPGAIDRGPGQPDRHHGEHDRRPGTTDGAAGQLADSTAEHDRLRP